MAAQFLRRVIAWLRGGSAGLNDVEAALIANVLEQLPTAQAQQIREQIKRINLVQRPQRGRMTIMFHRKPLPLLENREYEVCLAQVTYTASTGHKRKAMLVLHSGFLQTIEGNIPGALDELRESTVTLWPGLKSRTPAAIDRLEHGSASDR